MKKVVAVVMVTLLILAVGGCSSGQKASPTFKVGLLVPGSINDQGWNASGYAGLMAIKDQLGAETSYAVAANPSDMISAFRQYGKDGYKLVVGHGSQYQDAAAQVAAEYPKTVFMTIGGNKTAANLAPIVIKSEDVHYLFGIIAAMLSKSGTIGFVGGVNTPAISKTERGFKLGAQSVNPNIKFKSAYIGNYDDVAAGKEAALAEIAQGADVIMHNGNSVGLGALQACVEKKVWTFGMSVDQTSLGPNNVIASNVTDMSLAYVGAAKAVKGGTFNGKSQEVGLKDGAAAIVWNPAVKAKLSQAILDAVDKAAAKIKSGEIHVPGENE
ncbi:MAG TPA: BMP family protein [Bacillota bacterium]